MSHTTRGGRRAARTDRLSEDAPIRPGCRRPRDRVGAAGRTRHLVAAAANEPRGHVPAHPAESDHPELHPSSPSRRPSARPRSIRRRPRTRNTGPGPRRGPRPAPRSRRSNALPWQGHSTCLLASSSSPSASEQPSWVHSSPNANKSFSSGRPRRGTPVARTARSSPRGSRPSAPTRDEVHRVETSIGSSARPARRTLRQASRPPTTPAARPSRRRAR